MDDHDVGSRFIFMNKLQKYPSSIWYVGFDVVPYLLNELILLSTFQTMLCLPFYIYSIKLLFVCWKKIYFEK